MTVPFEFNTVEWAFIGTVGGGLVTTVGVLWKKLWSIDKSKDVLTAKVVLALEQNTNVLVELRRVNENLERNLK